jgi:hypothetical protein
VAHLIQWPILSAAAPKTGMVIPTKGQSTTDLSPRYSLQIVLQKEFRYLLTIALSGSRSIT